MTKQEDPKERQARLRSIEKRWQQRFSIVKLGKEAFSSGDYATTIKRYNEFLKILADLHETDIMSLTPDMFDEETGVSEMLLVSQVYFELARVYDLSPQMEEHLDNCLKQFVLFTVNRKYQVVNAEMLRKLLKSKKFKNKERFEAAYKQILVESKRCFVATYAFDEDHTVTASLRNFKAEKLSKSKLGLWCIQMYYRISPILISTLEKNKFLEKLCLPYLRLFLVGVQKFIKK